MSRLGCCFSGPGYDEDELQFIRKCDERIGELRVLLAQVIRQGDVKRAKLIQQEIAQRTQEKADTIKLEMQLKKIAKRNFSGLDPAALDQFTGTENYYRYSSLFRNVVLSDGAKYVADNGGKQDAYWLMDAIASQIPKAARKNPMCRSIQFWELKVASDRTAILTCVPDADMTPVVVQKIPYTDFDLSNIKFYVQPQATERGII